MSEEESLPSAEECIRGTRDWPHAPLHRLLEAGVYFVTARAAEHRHLLRDDAMKDWFQASLLQTLGDAGWRFEAWAVLSNHYHFVAHSPASLRDVACLGQAIQKLHSLATKKLNAHDGCKGRTRLWHNHRETHITHQRSYLARLHYVHQNAVHHGLVRAGSEWKWCSARAFKEAVSPAWVRTIASFKYDEIARNDGDV